MNFLFQAGSTRQSQRILIYVRGTMKISWNTIFLQSNLKSFAQSICTWILRGQPSKHAVLWRVEREKRYSTTSHESFTLSRSSSGHSEVVILPRRPLDDATENIPYRTGIGCAAERHFRRTGISDHNIHVLDTFLALAAILCSRYSKQNMDQPKTRKEDTILFRSVCYCNLIFVFS